MKSKEKWRIPTIMELSVLLNTVQLLPNTTLWSSTIAPRKIPEEYECYWTGFWRHKQQSPGAWDHEKKVPMYSTNIELEQLSCLFVKDHNGLLKWSRLYEHITFRIALDTLKHLEQNPNTEYVSPRVGILDE